LKCADSPRKSRSAAALPELFAATARAKIVRAGLRRRTRNGWLLPGVLQKLFNVGDVFRFVRFHAGDNLPAVLVA
jgi:hypothetical protein